MSQVEGYNTLRRDVERTLSEGIVRAKQAVNNARLRTYWEVGDRLDRYLESVEADYGEQTVTRLARDVRLSRRNSSQQRH